MAVVPDRDCATSPAHWRMALSSARLSRTGNLSKDGNQDREKARAIRARQRAIGRELRRIYDGVVNEPVPDEFYDLLRKIDETESENGPVDPTRKPS